MKERKARSLAAEAAGLLFSKLEMQFPILPRCGLISLFKSRSKFALAVVADCVCDGRDRIRCLQQHFRGVFHAMFPDMGGDGCAVKSSYAWSSAVTISDALMIGIYNILQSNGLHFFFRGFLNFLVKIPQG